MKLNTTISILILSVLLFNCSDENILNPSESLEQTIPLLEVYIEEEDYQHLRANHAFNVEVPCRIFYKEKAYLGIIRPQGAGSRLKDKWAYRIELKDNDKIENLNKFNLSAQVYDKTMLKTTLTSAIYRQLDFPMFNSKHIFLKINNSDHGLYPLIERIEQPFFERRSLPVYELFKLGFDSRFTFDEPYNPEYVFNKEIPDDKNYRSLIEFIHAVDTASSHKIFDSLDDYLDIENYITYHAITSLINNFDAFTNNFLLHKKFPGEPFEIIPWDFDKSFYHEADAGIAGENNIIKKIFSNPEGLKLYKDKIKFLLNTVFTENNIFPIIDSTAAAVESFYEIDPYLKGVYNFDNEIRELKSYIVNRREFFIKNIDSYQGF